MAEMNKMIQEFEKSRVQLSAIESQGQSLTMQAKILEDALKELTETKEKKVYKAVGNILILTDVKKMEKDLSDQKESVDLRAKTVKKQEEAMLDKLNKLKGEIESAQKSLKGEGKEAK
ncbi:MAG TPA: prefoldin subunit [archaeon]|nr:prefoldin subunit [archaeon]